MPHTFNFQCIQTEVSINLVSVYQRGSDHVKGYAFRNDGRYFVLAERHKSKDTLGIYDTTDTFKLIRVRHWLFFAVTLPIHKLPALSLTYLLVGFSLFVSDR